MLGGSIMFNVQCSMFKFRAKLLGFPKSAKSFPKNYTFLLYTREGVLKKIK